MAYTVSPGSKTGSGPAAVAGSLYTRRGLRKYLTRDERQRVMAVCGDAPTDAKLLALTLLWTGARVSEVLALTPQAFQLDAGLVALRTLKRRRPVVREVGLGVMAGIATFGERLFEGLFGGPPPRRRAPGPPAIRPVPLPANDAGEAARRAAEVEAEAETARQRAVWWEERQRQHERTRD